MLFYEPHFVLVFIPLFIFAMYAGSLANTGGKLVICLFSTLFYLSFSLQYFFLLLASVGFVYSFQFVRSIPKALFFYTSALLLLLGFYKYSNFVHELLGGDGVFRADAILPLGISFFIFQEITFLVWAGSKSAEKVKFIDLFNYICFFPQLIAGPIATPKELLFPLRKYVPTVTAEGLSHGLLLFAIGVGKKVIIADSLNEAVSVGFSGGGDSIGSRSLLAILAFTLQIYFDFSGYMDMARGLAKMVGIELPPNFSRPFRALNITNFWQRWHMTLTRMIMAYVYTPLMMSSMRLITAKKMAEGMLNFSNAIVILCTMTLAGLWHGANTTFIAFGALHGLALAIDKYLDRKVFIFSIFRFLLMWLTVCGGFAFFRADSIGTAVALINSSIFGQYLVTPEMPRFLVYVFVAACIALLPRPSVDQMIIGLKPMTRTCLATVAYLAAIPWMDASSPFLYWQF